jgi:hypothetical protein
MKRQAPPAIRELCKTLVGQHGQRGAAKRLGISRTLLLCVLADQPVLPGSLALLEYAAFRVRDEGTDGPEVA